MRKAERAVRTASSFPEGFDHLRTACQSAADAVVTAERWWQYSFPAADISAANDAMDPGDQASIRVELMLTLQARNGYSTRRSPFVLASEGSFSYTTASGLSFGWELDREAIHAQRGGAYKFWVQHPRNYFPEGSSLLAALRETGWGLKILDREVYEPVLESAPVEEEGEPLTAEPIVVDDTPIETVPDFTEYVDPDYAARVMAESLLEDEEAGR